MLYKHVNSPEYDDILNEYADFLVKNLDLKKLEFVKSRGIPYYLLLFRCYCMGDDIIKLIDFDYKENMN